ncbi:helix-turn-helix domain-containing protein [Burkholderia gladioli]|uniref:helix-turn-helix domain-containing protein n=1 Tax=Burkholderia gladioli TaxID=28095 RepID=UPI003F7A48A1
MTNNTTAADLDRDIAHLIDNSENGIARVPRETLVRLRALLTSPRAAVPAADPWLISGSLLYRLTDERRPTNRDEISVTMADGSRESVAREARARQILALLDAAPAAPVAEAEPAPDPLRRRVERLLVELHAEGRLSEGQCVRVLDIPREDWRELAEFLSSATQAVAADGADTDEISGKCFIVIGHGESDIPEAKIIARREDLLDAVLGMIYTHASEVPDDVRAEYAESLSDDDEWAADRWSVDFEIGGIVIWRVGLHPVSLRAAVSPATADERAAGLPRKWLTVVYRDVTTEEVKILGQHPKWSASSWSHALQERDAARASQAAASAEARAVARVFIDVANADSTEFSLTSHGANTLSSGIHDLYINSVQASTDLPKACAPGCCESAAGYGTRCASGTCDFADKSHVAPADAREPNAFDRWEQECERDHGPYPEDAPMAQRLRWWIPKSARHGKTSFEYDISDAADMLDSLVRADAGDSVASIENPLTPYGLLVRALRIVAGTTLMEMATGMGVSPAFLSSLEFGRRPVTYDNAAFASGFFSDNGVVDTLPALAHAVGLSQGAQGGKGGEA